MTADEDSSDLSSLSSLSPVPSDVELDDASDDGGSEPRSGILKFFPKLSNMPAKEPSPPPRKRSPSPPHEYVLADNPDIAVSQILRLLHISIGTCDAAPGQLRAWRVEWLTPTRIVHGVEPPRQEIADRASVHRHVSQSI